MYGDDWVNDDINEFFVRYYAAPFIDDNKTSLPAKPGEEKTFMEVPYRFSFAHISDQKYTSTMISPTGGGENDVNFFCEDIKRTLPPTRYVLISTPILKTGNEGYKGCINRLDQFVGVLRAVCGNSLFREVAREATVSVPGGSMKTPSRTIRMPKPCEGTVVNSTHWDRCFSLLEKMEKVNTADRDRLILAVQLFEKAAREESPANFFLYWVSIEVLCDTHKTGAIKKKLKQSYSKSMSFIQNDLGFEALINLRTNVFHNGQAVNLGVDAERYIQVIFLDLLNAILGENCERYVEKYIESGFDLSVLSQGGAKGILGTINFDHDTKKIDINE